MARFADTTVRQVAGVNVPLPGVTIYVYDQNEALAELEEDGGGDLTNPVVSDQYGNFHFNADDGLYRLDYHYGGKLILRDEAVMVGEGLPIPDSVLTPLAAGGGSDIIGFLQSGTGAITRTVQDRLRDTNHAADFGFGKVGNTAAQNATALQNAVNRGSVVLPAANVNIGSATIIVPPGTVFQGQGVNKSIITCSGSPSFLYQAEDGTDVIQGPKFADMALSCDSGSAIRLNSLAGGFTNDGDTQNFIALSRFERLKINGPGAGTGIAIELNKTFHAVFDQIEIAGFETGVLVRGYDFPKITNGSRIWACDTLIEAISVGTYGSGLFVDACDLLLPNVTFIKSSDRHLIVNKSYFEKQNGDPLTGPVLDLENTYAIDISNNRFETPSTICPIFIAVAGNGSSFVFDTNINLGGSWGTVEWNGGDGATYYHNETIRQKIMCSGNYNLFDPPPFITNDIPLPPSYSELWRFSPSLPGLRPNYFYAVMMEAREQAFVFPPIGAATGVVSFTDATVPLSADVNIHILAKGTVASQEIKSALYNPDDTPISGTTITQALTTSWAWYTIHTGETVPAGLQVLLWNQDTGHNGDALVRQIVVTRA